jgi:hypothetical protein
LRLEGFESDDHIDNGEKKKEGEQRSISEFLYSSTPTTNNQPSMADNTDIIPVSTVSTIVSTTCTFCKLAQDDKGGAEV